MIVYEAHNKFFLPVHDGIREVSLYQLQEWEKQGVELNIIPGGDYID